MPTWGIGKLTRFSSLKIRYIIYFEKALAAGGFRANKLKLLKIRLHTCPHMDQDGGCDPWLTIEQGRQQVFSTRDPHARDTEPCAFPNASGDSTVPPHVSKAQSIRAGSKNKLGVIPENMKKDEAVKDFEIEDGVDLCGDIRVVLYDYDNFPPRNELCCFLWFHTGFISQDVTIFEKDEIDIAWYCNIECYVRPTPSIQFTLNTVTEPRFTFHSTREETSSASVLEDCSSKSFSSESRPLM